MLDLTVKKQAYQLKWFDGKIINIKAPTQGLLQKIIAMQDNSNDDENENNIESINQIYDIVIYILNRNYDNRKFTEDEIKNNLDIDMCITVLQDYVENTLAKLGK